MLELPDDWQNITTGYVLRDLLLQANAIGSYPEAARACVKAAIDFMLAGPRWKKHDPPVKVISSASGWQLNDWLFHVMPGADDDAFQAIDDLPSVMEILMSSRRLGPSLLLDMPQNPPIRSVESKF
jgi:hypothetical protein